MGVVDYKGDLIVPAVYQKIEYDYPRDDRSVNTLVFLAYDENEVVHVIDLLMKSGRSHGLAKPHDLHRTDLPHRGELR